MFARVIVKCVVCLMCIVALPWVQRPKIHVLSLPMLIAVICLVVSGFAVVICTIIIRRHCARPKVPIRDRIVSMHANALYLQDSAAVFDKDIKNRPMSTAPLLAQLVPHISGHMPDGLTMLSEYEIPLDKKWEFPREWYVKHSPIYV